MKDGVKDPAGFAAAPLALALYCLLLPVGLALRAVSDPLRRRHARGASSWRPVPPRAASIARARRLD